MTSFAFIFGLLPLWYALGAGGRAREFIGTVTIVGMVFSSAFAIFLVPVLYVIVARWSTSRENGSQKEPVPPGRYMTGGQTQDRNSIAD